MPWRSTSALSCNGFHQRGVVPHRSQRRLTSTSRSVRLPHCAMTAPPPPQRGVPSTDRRSRRRRRPGVITAADQPTGYRGIVTERHPVVALPRGAVAGDSQPDSAVARADVERPKPCAPRRRTRRLDHHVRSGEQRAQTGGSSKSATYEAFRRSSSRSTQADRTSHRRDGRCSPL